MTDEAKQLVDANYKAATARKDTIIKLALCVPSAETYEYIEKVASALPSLGSLQDKSFDLESYLSEPRFEVVKNYYKMFEIPIEDILRSFLDNDSEEI